VHMNPVFDSEGYEPRALSRVIPSVGLRDAEDIPTMIAFARFACGDAPLHELEDYLGRRARRFVEAMERRRARRTREAGAAIDEAEGGVS